MVIIIISIAFLIIGLIIRMIPKPVDLKAKGPLWKTRMAFETKKDFTFYVIGTVSIGLGALFLFIKLFID